MKILIDGMNVAYRCWGIYDKKQHLSTPEGFPTGTIYGFLRTLSRWYFDHHETDTFYVAWESPSGSNWREEKYADYKGDREKDRDLDHLPEPTFDPFQAQLEVLRTMLTDLGIHQVWAEGYEADDVIASLADRFEDDPVIIVSSDHDFLQLVDRSTTLVSPDMDDAWDWEDVQNEYDVPPDRFDLYRSLWGDSSDNLPGLPHFRSKVIARLVRDSEDGTVESVYDLDFSDLTDKEREKLGNFREQAEKNYDLISLDPIESFTLVEGSPSEDWVGYMCDLLHIESIKTDLMTMAEKGSGFMKYSS